MKKIYRLPFWKLVPEVNDLGEKNFKMVKLCLKKSGRVETNISLFILSKKVKKIEIVKALP